MPKLCICQICVCGRHRCPHKFTGDTIPKEQDAKGKFTSETKRSYKCNPNQSKAKPIKPSSQWIQSKGDMMKTSTTTEDYTPKQVSARQIRQREQYTPPKNKMFSQTTYKKDYTPNMSKWPAKEPSAKSKEPNISIPNEKMDCRTTQKRDFVLYDRKCADACRAKPITYRTGTLTVLGQEFKGETEAAKSYKPPMPGRTARIVGTKKPDNLFTEGKMEGKSTTATDYPPRKCGPRIKGKQKAQGMKWPQGDAEKTTTYKLDYGPHCGVSKTKPCGPKPAQIKPPDEPFSGQTMYKTDYPAHEANPIRGHLPWQPKKDYEKPTEEFAGDTTYKKDYMAPPEDLQPERGRALKANLTVGTDPMAKVTTHRNDYMPYSKYQPAQSTKQSTAFVPPKVKFADESITKHDYLGEKGLPATPVKKMGNLRIDDTPMDLVSMSAKDYLCQRFDCPAAKLKLGEQEALDQYKFVDSSKGHEYYQTPKTSKK